MNWVTGKSCSIFIIIFWLRLCLSWLCLSLFYIFSENQGHIRKLYRKVVTVKDMGFSKGNNFLPLWKGDCFGHILDFVYVCRVRHLKMCFQSSPRRSTNIYQKRKILFWSLHFQTVDILPNWSSCWKKWVFLWTRFVWFW